MLGGSEAGFIIIAIIAIIVLGRLVDGAKDYVKRQ